MKLEHLFALVLCILIVGCSTPTHETNAYVAFEPAIDELCRCTGMKRAGAIRSVETWGKENPSYGIDVRLGIDSSVRLFKVVLQSDRRLVSFAPEGLDLSHLPRGLGHDEVRDPEVRARCIAAVKNLNRCLRAPSYGKAAIQRMRGTFVVTYMTIPPDIQKMHIVSDPFISFVVTPKGTVCAVLYGA